MEDFLEVIRTSNVLTISFLLPPLLLLLFLLRDLSGNEIEFIRMGDLPVLPRLTYL